MFNMFNNSNWDDGFKLLIDPDSWIFLGCGNEAPTSISVSIVHNSNPVVTFDLQ